MIPDRISLEDLEDDERAKANPGGEGSREDKDKEKGKETSRRDNSANNNRGDSVDDRSNVPMPEEERIMVPPADKTEDKRTKEYKDAENKRKAKEEKDKVKAEKEKAAKKTGREDKPSSTPKANKSLLDSLFDGLMPGDD